MIRFREANYSWLLGALNPGWPFDRRRFPGSPLTRLHCYSTILFGRTGLILVDSILSHPEDPFLHMQDRRGYGGLGDSYKGTIT